MDKSKPYGSKIKESRKKKDPDKLLPACRTGAGRPKGAMDKISKEAKEFIREIVDDEDLRADVKAAIKKIEDPYKKVMAYSELCSYVTGKMKSVDMTLDARKIPKVQEMLNDLADKEEGS